MSVITKVRGLARDEQGQDLLEYALLISLIALVCVIAITSAGNNVNTIFTNIATALTPAA